MQDIDVSIHDIETLTLEVDLANDGASRFVNDSTEVFDMVYYEITSEEGSLRAGNENWTSFDDGEGGDPLGTEWDEAGGSGANALSEINLTGMPKLFDSPI